MSSSLPASFSARSRRAWPLVVAALVVSVMPACGSAPQADGPATTVADDAGVLPVDGAVEPQDAGPTCAQIRCEAPPPPVCVSATTRRAYAVTGSCRAGVCSYPSTEETCAPASCRAGVATLASTCTDGRCTDGGQTTCTFGCDGDRCALDPCAGVTCTTPPAADCLDANHARAFPAQGVCNGGACSYAPRVTACAATERCEAGQCACVPETDLALCASSQATCGSIVALDRCGSSRTVASCGTCVGPEFCGGGGSSNRCGVPSALLCDRYSIVDSGTGDPNAQCPGRACDGSGLVRDTQTGLVWSRFEYQPPFGQNQLHAEAIAHCASLGMRLPTRQELVAIAGANHCSLAIPSFFSWTSDFAPNGNVWLVAHQGIQTTGHPTGNTSGVLCVRAGS